MKRYLGKATFEGFEVADSDFEDLIALREEEAQEIEDTIQDFETDVEILRGETSDEVADLKAWRDSELAQYEAQYEADVVSYIGQSGEYPPYSEELLDLLGDLYEEYLSDCEDTNDWYDEEFEWLVNQSTPEHDALVRQRDSTIEYIHESFTSQINDIINARYSLPVYMINNKPGACDYCIELNRTLGTLSVLINKRLIPPFHYHCRCFLTQAGYVVMSGTTPFHISELLSEAAAEAGVKPTSLVPSLPPPEPSREEEREEWLAQIAAWWAFWTAYYPIPTKPMYVLHG